MGIVKLHGGSLYLDSQPGAGTTAVVTLRARAAVRHQPRTHRKSRMTLHIEKPARPAAPPFRERRGLPAAPPIRLAHIVSVSGSHAVAVIERQDAIADQARVQIGALIKIVTPHLGGDGRDQRHQRADAARPKASPSRWA